jgi:hypothetical protein
MSTDIKQRLSEHHGRDLRAAIEGGYDSDPIFIDAKMEIERLEKVAGDALAEQVRLGQEVTNLLEYRQRYEMMLHNESLRNPEL